MREFDINKIPKAKSIPTLMIESPITFTLENGLKVLVMENHQTPVVEMNLLIDNQPFLPTKAGLVTLTNMLFGKATKNKNTYEFNQEVEYLGANLTLKINGGHAVSLSKHFPQLMELFAQAAFSPLFLKSELENEKKKLIESLKARENSSDDVAHKVANILLYSPLHPYGTFASEESVKSIEITDIENIYTEEFIPERAYLVLMGDITPLEGLKLVEKYFSSWKPLKNKRKIAPLHIPKNISNIQLSFIDMPQAVQASVGVYYLTDFKISNEDYFAGLLMNYILGGSFSSYINMNLREKNGYTYGANSSLETNRYTKGVFSVQTKVRTDATISAVNEILKELHRIQTQEVSPTELHRAKEQFLGVFIMSFERDATFVNFALKIQTNNLPDDFYHLYTQRIAEVTSEDILRVAQKYININNIRIVVAGNAQEIESQFSLLQFLGKSIPVQYFDKNGNLTKS